MRSKKRLALAGSGFVVLAVTAALLVTAGPATAEGTATLRIIEGAVSVNASGEDSPGRHGQTLEEGDVVTTGVDGRAQVAYFDGSVTRLDRQTSFTVAEVQRVEEDGKRIAAAQQGGRTFSRVVKLTGSESRFEVATPTATASVRGTIFDTTHRPDGSSDVLVLEGAVLVAGSDERTVTVTAFQGVHVDSDGTTRPPYLLRAWQLHDPWIQLNLCEIDNHFTCQPDRSPSVPSADTDEKAKSGGGDVVLGSTVTRDDAGGTTTQSKGPSGPSRSSGGGGGGNGGGGNGGGGGGGGGDPDPPDDDPTLIDDVCAVVESVLGNDVPPPC